MMKAKATVQLSRSRGLSWSRLCATALGLALSAAGAHAGDVYWSLGMQAPGVVLGAGNVAPVYVAPAPLYIPPPPVAVYQAPVAVYPAPRTIVAPAYGAAWAPPGHFKHRHHGRHWPHGRDGWNDGWRHERD